MGELTSYVIIHVVWSSYNVLCADVEAQLAYGFVARPGGLVRIGVRYLLVAPCYATNGEM